MLVMFLLEGDYGEGRNWINWRRWGGGWDGEIRYCKVI